MFFPLCYTHTCQLCLKGDKEEASASDNDYDEGDIDIKHLMPHLVCVRPHSKHYIYIYIYIVHFILTASLSHKY